MADERNVIAFLRYADDVLAISFVLCDQCRRRILIEVCSDKVAFEDSTESFHFGLWMYVKFLDFWALITYGYVNTTHISLMNSLHVSKIHFCYAK